MRVVCSPQSSNERRKECERFLDQTFRENFEENYELVLDILKGVGKNGVNGGRSSSEEEESIEVSVFVNKCVLQYLRRAKMETDKSSHSTNDNNNLLLRILFQSIVSNDLLSLRGEGNQRRLRICCARSGGGVHENGAKRRGRGDVGGIVDDALSTKLGVRFRALFESVRGERAR